MLIQSEKKEKLHFVLNAHPAKREGT
jgi:hypothetical protein